mmetsp:Transcript_85984/g.241981  ORF Transcript_85984/g.241981 Transcript_85984/m.241981 type:complete len:331 (+) Transcript_85984:457-1449(+)
MTHSHSTLHAAAFTEECRWSIESQGQCLPSRQPTLPHYSISELHGGQEVLQLQNPGHQLGDLVADLRLPGLRRAPAPDRHARRDERASDAQRGLGDGDRRRCKVREARRHFRGRARGSVRHGSRRKRDVHGLRGDVALAHPSVPLRRGAAREGRPKLAGTGAECLARAHPLRNELGEDERVPSISGELRAEGNEVVVVCEGITSKRQPACKGGAHAEGRAQGRHREEKDSRSDAKACAGGLPRVRAHPLAGHATVQLPETVQSLPVDLEQLPCSRAHTLPGADEVQLWVPERHVQRRSTIGCLQGGHIHFMDGPRGIFLPALPRLRRWQL